MDRKALLQEAVALKPEERFLLIDGILKSLNQSNIDLDQIWAEEAGKRLLAYRQGKLQGVPMEEIF